MSGMVLTQLLNPESGIDRQSADKALEGIGRERSENGPSRYDEVVRQQEKRLEQKRAEERATERDREEAARKVDQREQSVADRAAADESGRAANDRRNDSDRTTRADGSTDPKQPDPDGQADKQTAGRAADGADRATVSEDPGTTDEKPAMPGLVEALDGADPAEQAALALQGQAHGATGPIKQGEGVRTTAQIMASLTGTGQNENGLPTTGKLFAAMLEAGQEKGSQGRDLLASLQGGNVQTLTEATGKAADTLTAQISSRLAAPELTQSLNQSTSLRGADAQALMKNYSTSVDVPVGADEWGEKVMGKLAWLTASQMSVAEIHVTPPDMGPLEVRVQVQNDQAAVTIHATTPAVREQLELHGHRLRDMLSEHGLSLEGFDVSDSPGREASDQEGDGEASGASSGQELMAGADDAGDQERLETGELDLSWRGELDLYA